MESDMLKAILQLNMNLLTVAMASTLYFLPLLIVHSSKYKVLLLNYVLENPNTVMTKHAVVLRTSLINFFSGVCFVETFSISQ